MPSQSNVAIASEPSKLVWCAKVLGKFGEQGVNLLIRPPSACCTCRGGFIQLRYLPSGVCA